MHPASPLWPVAGILRFLATPGLWSGPLLATAGAWLLIALAALGMTWWTWPSAEIVGFWWPLFYGLLAIGYGLLVFVAGWMLVIPVVMALAYEQLVRRILIADGRPVVEEGMIASARSAVSFLIKTLHIRLGWLALGFVALILPPLSWLCATVGLGHVALLDAADATLAMQGRSGGERAALLRQHRVQLLLAGCSAGIGGQCLGATIIGWIFWMPGCYVAAAQSLPHWLDTTDNEVAT